MVYLLRMVIFHSYIKLPEGICFLIQSAILRVCSNQGEKQSQSQLAELSDQCQ